MANDILFTTAVDNNGVLTHVNDAQKGLDHFCPACGKEFILRKSGKTGAGSRRPHFAHKELTPNCKPETVLHYSFKKRLVDLVERHRAESHTLMMTWRCESCGFENSGNLLERVHSVEEEHHLGVCRPDIALLDDQGKAVAAIEIVVTHPPDEPVLRYYSQNRIALVQINLSSDEEFLRVQERIERPDIVDYCINPRCGESLRHRIPRTVIGTPVNCQRCFARTERYHVELDTVFGKLNSRDFMDNEIELVKSERKHIKVVTDKTTKGKHPVMTCLRCQSLQSRYRPSPRL